MAEHESTEEAAVAPTAQTAPTPAPTEKPWLYGQPPSMWFLITSGAVLLVVILMRIFS